MFLQRRRVMLNGLLFFVGVVFRIKALHLFGDAAVSITVKVNRNKGNACRGQVLTFGEDGRFGRGFLRGKYFFCVGGSCSILLSFQHRVYALSTKFEYWLTPEARWLNWGSSQPGKTLLFCLFLRRCFERKHDLAQGLEVIDQVEGLQIQRAEYPGQSFRTDVADRRIQSMKSPLRSLHMRQHLLQ